MIDLKAMFCPQIQLELQPLICLYLLRQPQNERLLISILRKHSCHIIRKTSLQLWWSTVSKKQQKRRNKKLLFPSKDEFLTFDSKFV